MSELNEKKMQQKQNYTTSTNLALSTESNLMLKNEKNYANILIRKSLKSENLA